MNHCISVCTEPGRTSKNAVRVPLLDVISSFKDMARIEKQDNWLMYGAFIDVPWEYQRKELPDGMKINVLLLDCDNDNSDKNILDKFRDDMRDYTCLTWETFSSTPERPKFRALVPLDRTLTYTKDVKQSIAHIFNDYSDKKATWYFAPDTNHLKTLKFNKGVLFPSSDIQAYADKLKLERERTERMFERLANVRSKNLCQERNPEGWRNFPSVKKCLDGLRVGERDSSLYSACFAMRNLGYGDCIQQFLDEVVCDNEIKNKFRRQFK